MRLTCVMFLSVKILKLSISVCNYYQPAWLIFHAIFIHSSCSIIHYNYSLFQKTIILLSYRWYSYKMIKNHYFMFDFCYYTNFLLLVYIWSPWQLGILFPILFGLCNGPLLWSVLLWRNSLVPHSVDKMTSLLLHLSPALTTWGLKW